MEILVNNLSEVRSIANAISNMCFDEYNFNLVHLYYTINGNNATIYSTSPVTKKIVKRFRINTKHSILYQHIQVILTMCEMISEELKLPVYWGEFLPRKILITDYHGSSILSIIKYKELKLDVNFKEEYPETKKMIQKIRGLLQTYKDIKIENKHKYIAYPRLD